jgi:5-methyltetrahydrofolate--homocysteine methyltransferase
MFFKEDWKEAKQRLTAWWEGGTPDRPVIQVFAPRDNPKYASEEDLEFNYDEWGFARNPGNPDAAIRGFRRQCAETYFGGEAYPNLWINLGAGVLGAYLGAEPRFESETVWFGAQWSEELGKNWEELRRVEFKVDNEWWRITRRITETASEAFSRYGIIGMTDLGGILDVVASLRGSRKLLIDLVRNPEDVKSLSYKIIEWWHFCYDELNRIIWRSMEGTSAWMNIWCPERWYPIQCDFAFMLSPKLFNEFVIPHVEEQCERLDRVIYHLDGPGQIPHLNSLLNVEELDGIQWVPGAGEELKGDDCGSPKWISLYRKILEAGKLLVLNTPRDKVIPLLKTLPSKKILIQTFCVSEIDAEKLIAEVNNLFQS